jgi:hypothetical protein
LKPLKKEQFWLNYKYEFLQDEINIRFLGLEMDMIMNCKTRVKLIFRMLGNTCLQEGI